MENYKLLTQKDLAERWQTSIRSIEELRNKGTLKPCDNVPGIKFTLEHIVTLEGINLQEPTILEQRRLQRQIKLLEEENERLNEILNKTLLVLAPVIKNREA